MKKGKNKMKKDDNWKWEFPFFLGKIFGMFTRKEVRDELRERGVTEEQLENFEKATEDIASSFYREKKK